MSIDRGPVDKQFRCDLPIREPFRDQPEDLFLPPGQRRQRPIWTTFLQRFNLYVADQSSALGEHLRMITPAGVVTTLCDQCLSEVGGIVVDPAGHNIYATEYYTSVVDLISIY